MTQTKYLYYAPSHTGEGLFIMESLLTEDNLESTGAGVSWLVVYDSEENPRTLDEFPEAALTCPKIVQDILERRVERNIFWNDTKPHAVWFGGQA